MKIPRVLNPREIGTKTLCLIGVNPLSRETPNSSGKGEAIIAPASTHIVYFWRGKCK